MDLRDVPTAVPFEHSFDARIGFEYDSVTAEEVVGHFDVRPEPATSTSGQSCSTATGSCPAACSPLSPRRNPC
jgi:hypothetical protein